MPPKTIVGLMGSSVAKGSTSMSTPEQLSVFLSTLKSHHITELDTARVYNGGQSEELLGEVLSPTTPAAPTDFLISTKAPGFAPHSLSPANILSNSSKPHKSLKQDNVHIYYIHGPDKATPLAEQCRTFAQLYGENRFSHFGLSNLSAAEVQEIHEICTREGYVLPTVYQGAYSPIHRAAEKGLFPTLRSLNIAFYAWGPLAGGLLAKPIEQLLTPKAGSRYHEMPMFGDMYLKASNIAALKRMNERCEEAGMSMMEATMRWFMHHAPLTAEDGVVLGASSRDQVDATLTACEQGPLPDAVVEGWEELWREVVESGSALPVPT